MNNNIKLSVVLVTYNHEKYITEALDSILMQDFDDKYEIVIADDLSTDNTLEIIKSYQERFNAEFIFLQSTNNLGITKNYQRAFEACRGEYIAVLEGDDYWTSPKRLSKHVDFLENNRECIMSFNRYIVYDMVNNRHHAQPWPYNAQFQHILNTDLIKENFIGNFSTSVYRSRAIKKIDESLYALTVYDWMLNIVIGQYGIIGYLPEVMSVYRLHSNGTWSKKNEEEKLNETIRLIDIYNEYLQYKYDVEFSEHKKRLQNRIDQIKGIISISNKQKIILTVKQLIPPIVILILKNILPPKLIQYLKNR